MIGGTSDPLNAHSTPDKQFTMAARSTRLGFGSTTPPRNWGDILTEVELDFTAGDPHPGGKPKLRQAWIGVGGWTLGHTWSNWIDQEAAPETVDLNGPIGATGYDTGRYTQVRYGFQVAPKTRLAFSLEQNQVAYKDKWGAASNPNIRKADGAYATTIQPDARYPTVVGALTYTDAWGHLGLRALAQNYGAYQPGTATAGTVRPNRWAGAAQLSGSFKLAQDTLVYSVYTGQGVGVYGFNPQAATFNMEKDSVLFYRSTGWQAGYQHAWTDRVRSNLIATGLHFNYGPLVAPSDIQSSRNYFANTIVTLSKHFEVGMEYGHEQLKTFGPTAVVRKDGSLGNTNHSNKLQVAVTAKF